MMKWTLSIIAVLFISVAAFGQVPFRTDQQAYQFGYNEGYQHGVADNDAGYGFDYTHSHRFQSGISYNTYVNARFRAGYVQGYKEGFYANNSSNYRDDSYYSDNYDRDRDDDHYYDNHDDRDYSDNRGYDNRGYDRYQNGNYGGFVTVFTNDRFDGSRVSFRAGHYPYLNGRLHNSIDSVAVRGSVRVILFDKPNFRGKSIVIDNDVFDLDDYNFGDKAESMIIERN